jgi:hypothetical protein
MIRPVLPANLSFRFGLHHSKENAHIAKSRLLFYSWSHEYWWRDDDVTYFFLPRNFIMSSSGKNNILLQDVTQRRKNKLQSDGFAVWSFQRETTTKGATKEDLYNVERLNTRRRIAAVSNVIDHNACNKMPPRQCV